MNHFSKILLLKNYLLNRYSNPSYSQEGEDLILVRIFEGQHNGFFIDVGAHHPLRFSNTYLLYQKGWTGLNLDATPGSMEAFNLLRPRDLNLEIGIADRKTTKTFYQFNEPAINTFDETLIKRNLAVGYQLVSQKRVHLMPLREVIHRYAKSKQIDLLSIDIEGLDLQALKSMDWHYLPKVIVIEQFGKNLTAVLNTPPTKLLGKYGYKIYAKTLNSVIYLRP